MRNRLFDQNDKYTQEAIELEHEVNPTLDKLFRKYSEKGYSVRDIESVLIGAVWNTALEQIMENDNKRNGS